MPESSSVACPNSSVSFSTSATDSASNMLHRSLSSSDMVRREVSSSMVPSHSASLNFKFTTNSFNSVYVLLLVCSIKSLKEEESA